MIPECDWCRRLRQWVVSGAPGAFLCTCDDHLIKAIDEMLITGVVTVRRWNHEAAAKQSAISTEHSL